MNWLLGFVMGLLSCLIYHRVEEPVHQSAEVADVIQAYTQGSKDLLALNPIDAQALSPLAYKSGA
jgi:hypothetical protein